MFMTQHFCEYDRNLDEPCGKVARFKWGGLWLCAEHWDETAEFLKTLKGIEIQEDVHDVVTLDPPWNAIKP
jgi:hypothetical protein